MIISVCVRTQCDDRTGLAYCVAWKEIVQTFMWGKMIYDVLAMHVRCTQTDVEPEQVHFKKLWQWLACYEEEPNDPLVTNFAIQL